MNDFLNCLATWAGPDVEVESLFIPSDWESSDLALDFRRGGGTFDIDFANRNPKSLNGISDKGFRYAIGPYLKACLNTQSPQPDLLESVVFHLSPRDFDGDYWRERRHGLARDELEALLAALHRLIALPAVSAERLTCDVQRAILLWGSLLEAPRTPEGKE